MAQSDSVLEKEEAVKEEKKEEVEEEEEEEEAAPGSTLFIKNLNFNTTEEKLQEVSQFIHIIHSFILTFSEDLICIMMFVVIFFICYRHFPNVGRSSPAPSPRRQIKQVLNIQSRIFYIKNEQFTSCAFISLK